MDNEKLLRSYQDSVERMLLINENQMRDNKRLSDLVTRHDTVLRQIAEVSGFTGVYTGVDVDPECSVLVDHVRKMREHLCAFDYNPM